MKLLIILVIAFNVFQPITPLPDDRAVQAANAYSSGNYQDAARLYEGLLTEFQSPETYFNLGNTYAQLGEDGYALVNYLRAAEYMPRDQELRLNLAMIRARRIEPVTTYSGFWEAITATAKESAVVSEFAMVSVTLWWIIWGLFLLRYTRFKRHLMHRFGLGISISLFIAVSSVALIQIVVESQRPSAVIIADDTQAMSGPGSEYLDLFELYAADEVRIVQRENEWVRVQQPNLREGWIRADQLEEV